jgi:transposase
MESFSLSDTEKEALELRHRACRDKRECDRIKAVLLSDEDWSVSQISQALRKHEDSIKRYLDDYRQHQKLTENRGGSEGYLNSQQTEQLIADLSHTIYFHQHQIIAHIKKTYNVDYTVAGINKWLHQHKFSYKQPKPVPHKFDNDKQADFIDRYTELKDSLNDDEPVLFIDAVHPTQATKITSGWIRKGMDKTIKTTGSRTRLNVIGAIQLGHLSEAVIKHADNVNGETISEFFQQIREQYKSSKTIHLILDGAGYHRSKVVAEAAKKQNIVLHFLPPYSPNLNPIERLWKVMNEHARNNQYFATAKEFRQKIEQFFTTTLPEVGSSLDSRINNNFQRLSSAN